MNNLSLLASVVRGVSSGLFIMVLAVGFTGCGGDETDPPKQQASAPTPPADRAVPPPIPVMPQMPDYEAMAEDEQRQADEETAALLAMEEAQMAMDAASGSGPSKEVIRQPKPMQVPSTKRVAAYKNVRVLEGTEGEITTLVPDGVGTRVSSHGWDGFFRKWDAANGTMRKICQGYFGQPVDVSRDGRLGVIKTINGIEVVDLSTCETVNQLNPDTDVKQMALSPDGQLLAIASNKGPICIWDLYTGEKVVSLAGHKVGPESLVFTPDGRGLLSGGWGNDPSLRLWDARSGQQLASMEHPDQTRVDKIAVSADGKFAAVHGSLKVTVWDLGQRRFVQSFGNFHKVMPMAFVDPDGSRLAVGDQVTLRIFDSKRGNQLQELKGHSRDISAIAVSADSSLIFTGGSDAMIYVWGESTFSPSSGDALPATANVSPLGRYREKGAYFTTVTFAADPRGVFGGLSDGRVIGVNVESGAKVREYRRPGPSMSSEATAIEASGDGKLLAVGDQRGNVTVFEVSSGRVVSQYDATNGEIVGLSFFPDSQRLALAGKRQWTVSVIDVRTGDLLSTTPIQEADHDILVHPNGEEVFYQGESGMEIVKIGDGAQVQSFQEVGIPQEGNGISADGSLIAGMGGSGVATWGRSSVRPTKKQSIDNRVRLARVSATGKYVVTVTERSRVQLWNAMTLTPVASVPVSIQGAIFDAAVHEAQGLLLIAGGTGGDGDLQVWKIN